MRQSTSTVKFLNVTILFIASLAIGMVVCNGQDLSGRDLLSGSPDCSHVIDMIHRYGVNQSCDTSTDGNFVAPSAYGPVFIPACETGDLSIVSVHQVVQADAACGPKFAVVISNCSTRCVENFSITAVGTLGRIRCFDPCTTVNVEKIHPKESLQVEVTLPIEAFSMGNRNGQIIGFQRLVIVIDSFDEFVETDEANNIKAYRVATLPFLEVTSSVTSEVTETQVSENVTTNEATQTVEQAQQLETTQPLTAQPDASVSDQGATSSTTVEDSNDALQDAWKQLNVESTDDGASSAS
ncbi:MAG: hypothetical protein ACF8CQ_16505 [Rhodopirellula sp. JB044]|uniref:hypothetical protein n=1 Tax=Rhodopirellula sp. JB044 TaxID=3342844 RepID=UPI00370C6CBA